MLIQAKNMHTPLFESIDKIEICFKMYMLIYGIPGKIKQISERYDNTVRETFRYYLVTTLERQYCFTFDARNNNPLKIEGIGM